MDLSQDQLMALHHVLLTRKAATSITRGIKYFLAKKKFYLERQKIDPNLIVSSRFLALISKNNTEDREKILNCTGKEHKDFMFESQIIPKSAGLKIY